MTRVQAGQPRNRDSIPGSGQTLVSSPQCPNRLWNPFSLKPCGYQGWFSRGQSGRSANVTIHLQRVPKLKKYCSSTVAPERHERTLWQ